MRILREVRDHSRMGITSTTYNHNNLPPFWNGLHIHGIADRARNDQSTQTCKLIRGIVEIGHPLSLSKIVRAGFCIGGSDWDNKADTIHGSNVPTTLDLCQQDIELRLS